MSLFKRIRSGEISKDACISSLARFRANKIELMRKRPHLGPDLYNKELNEINFSISLMESIVEKYDDLRLPLKDEKKG